jgi:hypothetical protein
MIVALLPSKPVPTALQQRAWEDYLRARDRAERSRRVEDGVAAGRAWARFLKLFEAR